MKKFLIFLVALILESNAHFEIKTFQLSNGLQVLCVQKRTSPIVLLSVWYKGGSSIDPLSKSGVAHFFEHMVFLSHHKKFNTLLENIGAEKNAFTTFTGISFYEIVPKEYLKKCLEFESQRMRFLDIDEETFQNEKKAILEERKMSIDSSPDGCSYEAMLAHLFNRAKSGIHIIGWQHEIESIQKEDLQTFHNTWMVPNNATIVVVGDFEYLDLKKWIEQYFSTIPFKETPKQINTFSSSKALNQLVNRSVINDQNTISYIFKIPFKAEKNFRKWLALCLSIKTLNQSNGFIKNIFQETQQIISDIGFQYIFKSSQFDVVILSMAIPTIDNLDQTENILKYIQRKMTHHGINENSLTNAKKQLILARLYEEEDIAVIASHIGWDIIQEASPQEIEKINETIQSITLKECNEVLKEVFTFPPVLSSESLRKDYDRD